jgi:hypothetical protein
VLGCDIRREIESGKHEHLCALLLMMLGLNSTSHIIEIIKRNHIDVIRPAGVFFPLGLIFITDSNSLNI